MIEKETLCGYQIEKETQNIDGQIIRILNENGNTLADHSILPLTANQRVVLSKSIGSIELDISPFKLYESAVRSFKEGIGIGTELWKYAELEFFLSSKDPYLRFVHDITDNRWTERKIPEVLQHLQSHGVPFKCLWQGNFLGERPAWIFLFG